MLTTYPEITFDQFKQHVLKSNEMTELPKYWVVKNDGSQLFKDTVIKYLNDTYQRSWNGCSKNSYYGYDGNDIHKGTNEHYKLEWFQNNPVELTLEQFINKSNMKEIIGYKCPTDLFKGRIAAGSIFTEKSDNGFVMYNKSHMTSGVPIEIVETWEPVYKEDDFKFGDWVIVINSHYSSNNHNGKVDKITEIIGGDYRIGEGSANFENSGGIRKATTQEIEAHLIAQAKEKGFNIYTRFTAVRDTVKGDITTTRAVSTDYAYTKEGGECGSAFIYDPSKDALLTSGCGLYVVYEQGKWATITPKEEIVSVGGKFDVKIKDGKIYHKSDDITTFVKDLVGYFNQVKQFGKYSATIKDVTFSKTGCQTEITTLGDWLHVWDMYNKLQK